MIYNSITVDSNTLTNALTWPETARPSTQIPLQTQCSYKTRDRSTEHTNTITNTMLLQDPRQVDWAHKYHYKHNALTRPETGRPSTQIPLQTQCSYTNTITNTMLLQDPRQVDQAHKYHYKHFKHNALTRHETGRLSTQIPLQTQCSYKTQDRSTEHTNTITNTMLIQDLRQVDWVHKTVYSYKTFIGKKLLSTFSINLLP